ncbi:hypothetical protein OY671_012822, partial [Metschnikowia pulcherrima]
GDAGRGHWRNGERRTCGERRSTRDRRALPPRHRHRRAGLAEYSERTLSQAGSAHALATGECPRFRHDRDQPDRGQAGQPGGDGQGDRLSAGPDRASSGLPDAGAPPCRYRAGQARGEAGRDLRLSGHGHDRHRSWPDRCLCRHVG